MLRSILTQTQRSSVAAAVMATTTTTTAATTTSAAAMRATRAASTAVSEMRAIVSETLSGIQEAGTWKEERIITSSQSSEIGVRGGSAPVLNFCANNYLGLSDDPEIVEAAKTACDTHGNGLSSVRFICGTQDIHTRLERQIADFHGADDSIIYASCFDANAAIFETLLTPEDAVISDQLNHASIIDGIRLCKATKKRYLHRDMRDLEAKLEETADARMRLIVTDGVFSMDGTIAPMDEICDLADRHKALVLTDECHSTGLFGATGRGVPEHFGVEDRGIIVNSTLGKALGGAMGGYTAGPQELVTLLRQKARPYLFSNSLAPPVVGGASKVFDIIADDPSRVEKLASNTARFREKMTAAGFTCGGDPQHPICPIMLGDARLAIDFADEMLERGIFVIGFSYPVVPMGQARIRVQISAGHSEAEIDRAVSAFTEVGQIKGVL